jgi:hypothetical protein
MDAKGAPTIQGGQGSITIIGSGQANERIDISITDATGTNVYSKSGNLDADGQGTLTVSPLLPGTYTVTVTAYPGGNPVPYTQQATVT